MKILWQFNVVSHIKEFSTEEKNYIKILHISIKLIAAQYLDFLHCILSQKLTRGGGCRNIEKSIRSNEDLVDRRLLPSWCGWRDLGHRDVLGLSTVSASLQVPVVTSRMVISFRLPRIEQMTEADRCIRI